MKQLIAHKATHVVAILIVIGIVGYAFLSDAKKGEALTNIVVGTLEVKVAPNGGDAGTESVMIGYSGLSSKDITGWSIENDDGRVYTFDSLVLSSDVPVKVCADATKEVDCSLEWEGGDVWSDTSGTLRLLDDSGAQVLSVSYTDGSAGSVARNTYEFTETVYEKSDSLRICHSAQGEGYSSPKAQVSGIIDRKKGHVTHTSDVIPPFFYSLNGTVGYFEGKQWPEKEAFYENGCL